MYESLRLMISSALFQVFNKKNGLPVEIEDTQNTKWLRLDILSNVDKLV